VSIGYAYACTAVPPVGAGYSIRHKVSVYYVPSNGEWQESIGSEVA